jgi:hypothetical protein
MTSRLVSQSFSKPLVASTTKACCSPFSLSLFLSFSLSLFLSFSLSLFLSFSLSLSLYPPSHFISNCHQISLTPFLSRPNWLVLPYSFLLSPSLSLFCQSTVKFACSFPLSLPPTNFFVFLSFLGSVESL